MTTIRGRSRGFPALVAIAVVAFLAGPAGASEPLPDADAPTVGAVEPPAVEGVIYDGVVTVTLRAGADGHGFRAGDPLPGAEVMAMAWVAGEALAGSSATTDPDGVAVLEGIARPDEGGPAVTLDIWAEWRREAPRDDGCVDVESFRADASADGAASVDLELSGSPGTMVECPEPTPEPVPGVAWDGSLEVTFLGPDRTPLAAGDVTLVAELMSDGADAVAIHKAFEMTEPDGTVVFTDLPRATADPGAPAIRWVVEALASDETDIDGCWSVRSLSGSAAIEDPVAGDQAATITAVDAAPEWGGCDDPGEGAPVVTVVAVGLPAGSAADESRDGATATTEPGSVDVGPVALTGAWAWASQTRADGATWGSLETALVDGTAEIRVHAWGAAPETSTLAVQVHGPTIRSETAGGCLYDVVLAGETVMEASFATDPPERIEVELAETRVEVGCTGATEPPESDTGAGEDKGESEGAADVTPPPTDATGRSALAHDSLVVVVAVLLSIVAAMIAMALVVRPRRDARRT